MSKLSIIFFETTRGYNLLDKSLDHSTGNSQLLLPFIANGCESRLKYTRYERIIPTFHWHECLWNCWLCRFRWKWQQRIYVQVTEELQHYSAIQTAIRVASFSSIASLIPISNYCGAQYPKKMKIRDFIIELRDATQNLRILGVRGKL